MSKEVKTIEAEVVDTQEVVAEVVEEKKGFLAKAKDGFKKHGKKLAVGAGVAAVGLLAFALGKKSGNSGGCCDFGEDDFEFDEDLSSDDTEI